MIRDKDTFQQIKNKTMERSPADFTLEVIRKAGITASKKSIEKGTLSNLLYGGACIITAFLICSLAVTNTQSVKGIKAEQAGKNVISLTKQLTADFQELINERG